MTRLLIGDGRGGLTMKYWTTKEISYIQKNALLAETNEVINIENIAKKLGRSVAAVSKKNL